MAKLILITKDRRLNIRWVGVSSIMKKVCVLRVTAADMTMVTNTSVSKRNFPKTTTSGIQTTRLVRRLPRNGAALSLSIREVEIKNKTYAD